MEPKEIMKRIKKSHFIITKLHSEADYKKLNEHSSVPLKTSIFQGEFMKTIIGESSFRITTKWLVGDQNRELNRFHIEIEVFFNITFTERIKEILEQKLVKSFDKNLFFKFFDMNSEKMTEVVRNVMEWMGLTTEGITKEFISDAFKKAVERYELDKPSH
jgi:hypothetical protein